MCLAPEKHLYYLAIEIIAFKKQKDISMLNALVLLYYLAMERNNTSKKTQWKIFLVKLEVQNNTSNKEKADYTQDRIT